MSQAVLHAVRPMVACGCKWLESEEAQIPDMAFCVRVNERAQSLGGDPDSIKARVLGDIALARAKLGDSELLVWL